MMLPSEYEVTRLTLSEATPGAALDSHAIAETLRSYAPDILQQITMAPPRWRVLVQVTTEGTWVGLSQAPISLPSPELPLIEIGFPAQPDQTLDLLVGEIATWESGHVGHM